MAEWIEGEIREIPCFVDSVPVQYTEALWKVLRKHGVPDRIIGQAFLKLEKKGIWFDFPFGFPMGWRLIDSLRSGAPPPAGYPLPHHQDVRAVSKADWDRSNQRAVEVWEAHYKLALTMGNTAEAAEILAVFLKFLWDMAKVYAKTKKAQGEQEARLREAEEWDRVVTEAYARARTLATHSMTLSEAEIRSLRDAPTPDLARHVARRIARRVVTRTAPARARARRTRK